MVNIRMLTWPKRSSSAVSFFVVSVHLSALCVCLFFSSVCLISHLLNLILILRNHFNMLCFFSLFNSVIRRRMICCSCSYFTVSTGSKSKTDGRKKNHYFFCSQKKNCCDGMDIQCFNVRCVHSVQQDLFHFC